MKKIISIILFIGLFLGLNAQTAYLKTSKSLDVTKTSVQTFLGATTDTLSASDTLTLVLRVPKQDVQDMNCYLKTTKVSGTVTNNFILHGSFDGVTIAANLDTFANSNASTNTNVQRNIYLQNVNFPYVILNGIAGATAQKAWYTFGISSKNK